MAKLLAQFVGGLGIMLPPFMFIFCPIPFIYDNP